MLLIVALREGFDDNEGVSGEEGGCGRVNTEGAFRRPLPPPPHSIAASDAMTSSGVGLRDDFS